MKNLHLIALVCLVSSCQTSSENNQNAEQLIIETLQKETKYFCERNLEKWQAQWSQQSFVSKMYAGNVKFEYVTGWEAINQFTVNHIKDNPEMIPIPDTNPDYTIELFEKTALVFYSKNGENGLIKEVRFMVKEGEKWKIARMQTIY